MDIFIGTLLLGLAVGLVLIILLSTGALGLVVISEQQVGIVVRKLGGRPLKPGQLIALDGEAGYQADTLAPGWHFWYWPVLFHVLKVPMIQVPQGEIALVFAPDGAPMTPERILERVVESAHLQASRQFFQNGAAKHLQP